MLRKCYYHKEKITDEQIDAYAYYGSLPGGREALVATAQQIVPEDIEAVTARYQTIKVPVLIVWGEEDEVVPVVGGQKFQAGYPELRTGHPAPMRPYPPGRGAGGDHPYRRGFLKKLTPKDK